MNGPHWTSRLVDDTDATDAPAFGDDGICLRCGRVAPLDSETDLCAACGEYLRSLRDESLAEERAA